VIAPIGGWSSTAVATPVSPALRAPADDAVSAASGSGFADALSRGLASVVEAQKTSSELAVKAATGDLTDVHDYMIASTEASVATELTVAVRNKAVEAFNEIMRMQM
jgi:flagellar hook-basal body complex protein FliE